MSMVSLYLYLYPVEVEIDRAKIIVRKMQHSQQIQFTFIDLFSGIGSFHYSFKQLGGECVLACDIDPVIQ